MASGRAISRFCIPSVTDCKFGVGRDTILYAGGGTRDNGKGSTMTDKIPNEQALIDEAMRRRRLNEPTISSEQMRHFKSLLGEEIERTGELSKGYVDQLLLRLKNGEL